MLGASGIIVQESLKSSGLLNIPHWYDAGATKFAFLDFKTLVAAQIILMGWAETRRYMDYLNDSKLWEEQGFGGLGLNGYPGNAFDPLGFSKDPKMFAKMQQKEIANGRLAMLAMLGFYGQAGATGTGPIENWLTHIADPFHTTVATNSIAVPFLK
jgi:light-harvesting complex I chlorophyll a/b binding protein 5